MKKLFIIIMLLALPCIAAFAQDATIRLQRSGAVPLFKKERGAFVLADETTTITSVDYYIKDDVFKSIEMVTSHGTFQPQGTFTITDCKTGATTSYIKLFGVEKYIRCGDVIYISNLKSLTNLTGLGTLRPQPEDATSRVLTSLP